MKKIKWLRALTKFKWIMFGVPSCNPATQLRRAVIQIRILCLEINNKLNENENEHK